MLHIRHSRKRNLMGEPRACFTQKCDKASTGTAPGWQRSRSQLFQDERRQKGRSAKMLTRTQTDLANMLVTIPYGASVPSALRPGWA